MKLTKEQLQCRIKDESRYLESLPKKRLGELLYACVCGGHLSDQLDRYKEYRLGKFGFKIHKHDTGIGVVVNLYSEDGDYLEIVQRTYWFNESQYGHNKYTYFRGPWDNALGQTIESIRNTEITYRQKWLAKYQTDLDELLQAEKQHINKFAQEFL